MSIIREREVITNVKKDRNLIIRILKIAFRETDQNQNGFLDETEFGGLIAAAVERNRHLYQGKITQNYVRFIMERINGDPSHRITEEQFVAALVNRFNKL